MSKAWGVVALLGMLGLAGCLAQRPVGAAVAGRVEVFGIAFGAAVDYRQIAGVSGSDEPCLHGYERSFDPLEIAIGYGSDRRVRKIVTRNPATRIFGVKPGMRIEEGEILLRQAGLTPGEKARTWRGEGFAVTLLADAGGTIFGVALEADD